MPAFDETKLWTQENFKYYYHQIKIWHETCKRNVYRCYGLKTRHRYLTLHLISCVKKVNFSITNSYLLYKILYRLGSEVFLCVFIYLPTVACETSIPNFNNSPWILGAPRRWFDWLISNKFPYFRTNSRSTKFITTFPSPEQLKSLFMPANDGCWFYNDEWIFPTIEQFWE